MRIHLTFTLVLVSAIALAGCALTPDQLKAIGESRSGTTVCFYAKAPAFESTTVVTNGGADGKPMLLQVAPNCGTGNGRAIPAIGN